MKELIKAILKTGKSYAGHKKWLAAGILTAALIAAVLTHSMVLRDAIEYGCAIWAVTIGAQGLADIGKSAAELGKPKQ